MSSSQQRSVEEILKSRKPLLNTNKACKAKLSKLDNLALWITKYVGTIGFFILIATWTIIWLSWNLFAPEAYRFDQPNGFTLWLFISNLIQILLMPLIMIGQNLHGQHAEMRAEHDFEVNVKAETEIEAVLVRLEEQNKLLNALAKKIGAEET